MRSFIAIILLFGLSSAQMKLNPGTSYKFDSTHYAYNERQILKIDSLIRSGDDARTELESLRLRTSVDAEIIDSLILLTKKLEQISDLKSERMKLMSVNDSLLRNESALYRDLYKDASKTLVENMKSRPNGTLWFAVGLISGAATIYLSSVVLNNVGDR